MRIPLVAALIGGLAVLACTDSLSPNNEGAVRVSATIRGLDADSDGITVSIDGGAPVAVLPPESKTIKLQMGRHTMEVGGVAANCFLNGPDTRSVAINAAETLDVSVMESCASLTGVIEVKMPTTGPDPDADGYAVTLDAGSAQPISANGVVRFAGVSAGTHQIAFGGLAENCTGASASPVDVSVSVGLAIRDTARVVIGVSCTAVTGVIEVRSGTTGPDADPNGYDLSLDSGPVQVLAPNGIYHFVAVSGGPHSLNVAGLATNCTEPGPNPRPVNVTVGGALRDTQVVAIAVSCTATTGVIEITRVTSGPDQGANTYTATLDGGASQPLSSLVTRLAGVSGGPHSLLFSGFAPNCTPAGSNPIDLSIAVGGAIQDTVRVTLSVTCTATTGAIRVHDVSTGPWLPSQYLISRDGGTLAALPTGTQLLLGGVLPGSHSILLAGVPGTCTVTSPNPVTVDVAVSDTAEVGFDVECTSAPSTGAELVFTTTGANLDPSYRLQVFSDCYYCYTSFFDGTVNSNGTLGLVLPPGPYYYQVSDIAANCTGPVYGTFQVVDQQVATVPVHFTCTPAGTLALSVTVSGPDPDPSFYATVDGVFATFVEPGASYPLPLLAGGHSIRLEDVASNCSVAGPNPTNVTIAQDVTTNLAFAVTCVANPTLQVTVVTTGSNAPASYLVGVDADYYYGYTYSAFIAANGMASLGLPPGNHYVSLDQVPLNCTVTSGNNVLVVMTLGIQQTLAFAVTCH